MIAFLRRLHLYAGIVVGLQLFLWMVSGAVMSFLAIDLVRGERQAPAATPASLEATNYFPPGGVAAALGEVSSITLTRRLRKAVYIAETDDGRFLFDAETGARLSPLAEAEIRRLARRGYVGEGEIESLSLMDEAPQEYRGDTPVWRADFDDARRTRLYLSPETGEILSRRNRYWRIFDFFWMLHIMDYDERDDFNHPLLQIFSAAGAFFALSGFVMIFLPSSRSMMVRDWKAITGRADRQTARASSGST